ncbi:uncharacterized protein AMSG_00867 [Thecamonas trahens ATCC 50062]|uniref:Uncharacterized protein n=1 Tax=Thecamonas trahens ATCC 50062 TaxID=461836 RepID=A0A0L0DHC2_THETB|nr:hypothetical protein AMSG_00867 [Thecamonas trahens ATCC 50062]KNC50708.1 hypothetical protein AMSG_00867 [Thecamonas trahens ATCC 50062]|eukprot:XP_013762585.1 hypothetical protein AMSG_00867 [Thecamonas trahens ATCC 50062]
MSSGRRKALRATAASAAAGDVGAPPPGAPTNQNRFAWTAAAPPTSSASSPVPARQRTLGIGPFTASVRRLEPQAKVAQATTAADAAAAETEAEALVAAAAAADNVVAEAIREGARPTTRVIAPYGRPASSGRRRRRRPAADAHLQQPRPVSRNRKHQPGEPRALSKGFGAAYGIRESLKQYGVQQLSRPQSAPGRTRRVPDEALAGEPPFVHTIQYIGHNGAESHRVNPRLSTRLPRQKPRSKFAYAKNATSRRPSSAWFAYPAPGSLVPHARPAWH